MKQLTKELHQLDHKTYLPVFKRLPIAFSHGNGSTLVDVDGSVYIDALSGIAVNSLGHNHPAVTRVIQRQAEKLLHVSNFFVTEPQVHLAAALTKASGMKRVFFTNSGTESFEGGIKVARKSAGKRGRGMEVISMEHSFHGRSMAAIASGKASMQKGFGPMPEGFRQVPFNDIQALLLAVTPKTGVIVLEPIQGEGGVRPADPIYLKQVRELCDLHGIVLVFDEIQCGMARTGNLFAKDFYSVEPDIMLLAKALGNGMPIGAILVRKEVGEAMDVGDHGTTFGGNPIACATALEVLSQLERPSMLMEVKRKGVLLMTELGKLRDRFEMIREVRGVGLMVGVELNTEAKPIVLEMLERGVIANATAGNVLRLLPPLIITDDELMRVVSIFADVLESLEVTQ